MKKYSTLLILAFLLSYTGMAQWSWQYPIPQGNRLNEMTFKGNDNVTGYAIGNFGTILKSNDRGLNWEMLDSVTINNLNGMHFLNESLGYAVGDNGTILKANNTASWEQHESGTFYNLFDVAIANENKAFAVGYKGLILKSGADEWSIVNSGTINTLYGITFASPEVGIIVGDSGFMMRTADGGDNWAMISLTYKNALNDVFFPSASVGFIVGNEGLILKTTDAGLTWTDVSYVQAENNLYSVHFTDDNKGYVSGATGLILSTNNGGANWAYKAINTSLSFNAIYLLNPMPDTLCDTIIFCGDNGLIQRSDSCEVMNDITHGSSKSLNTITFYNDTLAFAVGGHLFNNTPLMLRSTDGDNWEEFKVDTVKRYLTDIFILNADTGYITGRSGALYRSDTSLSNWTPLKTGVTQTLYSVRFVAPNQGIAIGAAGTIIRSIEGDTTWQKLNSNTTKNLYKLYYKNAAQGGYAVGDDGIILRIKNNGNQINKIPSGTSVPLYDIKFPSDTVGFIVGYDGKIFKLRMAGGEIDEIMSVPSGVTTPLNEIFFHGTDTGYIAGEGGVILKSTDGGNSWLPQYTGTANNLRGLYFKSSHKGYAVGSGPSIITTENGGGGVITPFIPEFERKVTFMKLFPNPASHLTTITYDLPARETVQIFAMDLSGKVVAKFVDEIQNQGQQTKRIDVSGLKNGIYVLLLQAGQKLYAEKMIILE
jgi:photosystem II stability/assembly factor-like uncharacterized protein